MPKALVSITMLWLLSGCTLSVPQLSWIKKAMTANESAAGQPPRWLASFNQNGAVLIPYQSSGLTVFANEQGDAIAFDGWSIRSVIGFGLTDPVSASDKLGHRSIKSNQDYFSFRCSDWTLLPLSEGNSLWEKECEGAMSRITIKPDGSIIKIEMYMGKAFGNASLELF